MCEFSLDRFKSREAKAGEELVINQFDTGSKGLVSLSELPDAPAVCLKVGTKVFLQGVEATFLKLLLPSVLYHDGFLFPNRKETLLQDLDVGMRVKILSLPPLPQLEKESPTVEEELAVPVAT